ncbi:MAG: Cyclic di-GMP phosphodiesterase CdpA [Arcobacter lacus]|nr:MAG: Cyclic di-GMP phosphodiesterase CdpA [Arcobacter lacus]
MKTYNYSFNSLEDVQNIDLSKIKNDKNILVQIFCGQGKDILKDVIEIISDELKQAVLIGSSTDGEICNETISTHKIIIAISTFENTQINIAYAKDKSSFENGKNLAKKLIQENTKAILTFTDGANTNGEEFLNGISSINNKVIVCGGMAGDNASFKQTFISANKTILTRGAVAVALNSEVLIVKNAYNFNWSPIGIDHVIEEVDGNRVYKISGLKPVDFYKKYLGDYVAKALPATGIEFPLIVQKDNLSLARAVIAKHDDGSLSFAGNLSKGDIVKLGFGNMELIMSNPLKSLFDANTIKNSESFFIYACMARRRYMPNLMDVEIKPFSTICATSGFFTYGEFFHNDTRNELLNQTLTVVSMSEKNDDSKIQIDKNLLENNKISDHARSLQALTHLIEQSSVDYLKQSKELEIKSNYAQNLLTAQKQFLKYAVHETNTPLSVIMGNIEMFEIENGKNKYLSNIEVAMKNIVTIYDDLSYLIKKDYINPVSHKINLVDFVRSRVEFFDLSAKKSKKSFNFESCSNEIYINLSEVKLQRLVDNNLTNAIKYTFVGEVIDVNVCMKDNECKLIFKSNSTQILDKDKIFEEYYREKNSQEGFGLGLNLVKRICTEENIKIELESNEKWNSFTYIFKGII